MADAFHAQKLRFPAALSLPILEDEINHLSVLIDIEVDIDRAKYLCATYQALCWARNPNLYAAPSEN
jgi:hypothetical protein